MFTLKYVVMFSCKFWHFKFNIVYSELQFDKSRLSVSLLNVVIIDVV